MGAICIWFEKDAPGFGDALVYGDGAVALNELPSLLLS
jgi:hypothetical protein